jgi:hypothetical protein
VRFVSPIEILLSDRGRVDLVEFLFDEAVQHADQRLDREQARVALGDPSQELGVDAVDRGFVSEHDRDSPERAA